MWTEMSLLRLASGQSSSLKSNSLSCPPRPLLRVLPTCVLILLSCYAFSNTRAQLPSPEQYGMSQLFRAYPDLASVPYWESLSDDDQYYGRSWTSNFSNLCQSGDGYELYGVYCKNGHVNGLRVTAFWGLPTVQNFGDWIGSLTFLKNFTAIAESHADSGVYCLNLTIEVVNHVNLEHLEVPDVYGWWLTTGPGLPASLVNLTSQYYPGFSFSAVPNLKYLRLSAGAEPPKTLSFLPHSTLNEMHLEQGFVIEYALGNLTSYPQLRVLSFVDGLSSSSTLTISTSTLTTLRLYCSATEPPPMFTRVVVTSSSLEALSTCTANVTLTTPRLYDLESGFPNAALPPLRWFELQLPNNLYSDWETLLCPPLAASHTTLELFSISFWSIPKPFSMPSCFSSFTSLNILGILGATLDSSFLQNVPKTNLTYLYMTDFSYPLTFSNFYQFPNLEILYISDDALSGTIPENFFLNLPSLSVIEVYSANLVGTIPWYGWSNLDIAHFEGSFTSWPGIDSAPLARYIAVNSYELDTIPGDDALIAANLNMLQVFKLYLRPTATFTKLTGPIPAFWARLPNIRYVWMTGNFSGTLPSQIAAPRLESLRIWSTNYPCGSLPEFIIPTHLRYFYGGSRGLTGTIPASWEQNLTIIYTLELHDNFLTGTIPPHLLDHNGLMLTNIWLENNSFTGSLWNMSRGAPYNTLAVGMNDFDLCQVPPVPPLNRSIRTCDYSNVPACPTNGCLTAWNDACTNTVSCTATVPTTRTPPVCIIPPARPSPILPSPLTCPPPKPEGFTCTDGQWVYHTGLEVPTITLPPNIGVVVIEGNFTTTGPVVFSGTGTTLEVNGCFKNLGEIVVEIDPEEKPKKVTLLTQKGSNCTVDLSSVHVELKSTKKSCKEAKTSSSGSTPSSLVLTFTIDSSKCNTKWIIIGCVLGAVVILGVIIVIVIHHYRTRKPEVNRYYFKEDPNGQGKPEN